MVQPAEVRTGVSIFGNGTVTLLLCFNDDICACAFSLCFLWWLADATPFALHKPSLSACLPMEAVLRCNSLAISALVT